MSGQANLRRTGGGSGTAPSATPATRYLVEVDRPEGSFLDVQALAGRSRTAADELSQAGKPLRLLRSIYVPEDESLFLLFEAESVRTVEDAATRAGLGVVRTVEVLRAERSDNNGGSQ